MGPGRPAVDPLLDTHVDLAVTGLEPEAPPALQALGLLDLGETERHAVKNPRQVDTIRRDGDLHVIDTDDPIGGKPRRIRRAMIG